MRFAKLHGLGNDFVVVDLRGGGAEAERIQEPLVATRVCSRRFGVGADGILAILPPLSGDARMRVINADGSEAEMCGNGLRCVAKYLVERDEGFAALDELIIDTGAGPLRCRQVRDDDRGTVTNVQVEMGRPGLLRKEIPISGPPRRTRGRRRNRWRAPSFYSGLDGKPSRRALYRGQRRRPSVSR